jgi:hypothetical protein
LYREIGSSDLEIASKASEECLDDVWFEIDGNDTGFISWHKVK